MQTTTAAKTGITSEVVLPFVASVRQVFQKMVGVEAKVGPPRLKTEPASTHSVCGIIGLSGRVSGSVVVSFSEEAAAKLVERFAGSAYPVNDPNFADAIGELANMIAGGAKQHLNGVASISVPSVVIGKGYTVAAMSDTPCIVIPCSSPFGEFTVEVCLKGNVGN